MIPILSKNLVMAEFVPLLKSLVEDDQVCHNTSHKRLTLTTTLLANTGLGPTPNS